MPGGKYTMRYVLNVRLYCTYANVSHHFENDSRGRWGEVVDTAGWRRKITTTGVEAHNKQFDL